MTNTPKIIAIGVVDSVGIASTSIFTKTWVELDVPAPGNGRTFRALTGKQDKTFRRLDRPTRALVLAAEACDINTLLSPEQRDETALVIETSCGCIEADLRYAHLLKEGTVHAAIFPYTLQSTCLGDVALRHGLRGPTLSLSIERSDEGEALWETQRLLVPGGPPYALAGMVDALNEQLPDAEPVLRAVTCLVAAPSVDVEPITPWPEGIQAPFAALAEACRKS